RLNCVGPLEGTGLRYVPVTHTGNQNDSPEEVERVTELVDGLLRDGATWTDKRGETRSLTLQDILIVAPYNAQVSALAARLPAGARVGTVDKFQGQQAPVCPLLHGDFNSGGRAERDGIPLQPEPAQRGRVPGTVRGRNRSKSGP